MEHSPPSWLAACERRAHKTCGSQVMQTLKDLAREGCTVVCSIHQPRSSIFTMFDDLLILSEGKLLYEGSAEGSLNFFEAQACIPVTPQYIPTTCLHAVQARQM